MSIYGVMSLIIWFGGAQFGTGYKYRIIMIALVMITIPFALVGNYLFSRKKKTPDESKEESKSEPDKKAKPTAKNDPEFDSSVAEVVEYLRSSNIGGKGVDSLYALPWYLVSGDSKSGKSSLILGSGLDFETLPSQRRSEQHFIRPTRETGWQVTNEAVFIDTPGKLHKEGSEDEWDSVLKSLSKNRPKRPIDGLILAVNTEDILKSDERGIEQLAKTVRERLDQTIKIFKLRFPVYLVFTNADAIEGFRDSFSTSKAEGETLVWGATFPLENSDEAQSLFDGEFELLQESIMKRRLIRLSSKFSPTRQLRIFNFPLHFASARRKLGTFVTTLFRPNPFSERPFLRGFYFTSVPVNRKSSRGAQTVGQTYFTKPLFNNVILRDRDLAHTFQAQKQKPPIFSWLFAFTLAFGAMLLLSLSALSLFNNKRMLNVSVERGNAVLQNVKDAADQDPNTRSANDTRNEMDNLENLRRNLEVLDTYEREGAPLYMRFGLYDGNRILRERLMNIYFNAIEKRFKQPTLARLQADLRTFNAGDTGNLSDEQENELGAYYDKLKVYLMWTEQYKDQAEPTSFSDVLADTWVKESRLPSEYRDVALAQLNFYFKQIDREKEYSTDTSSFPRIPQDTELVAQARGKLRAYPHYLRYLKRVTTEVSKEVDAMSVETMLAGRSLGTIEGTHVVPGAYTIEGYRKHMKEKLENANEELAKDDWVMGEKAEDGETKTTELGVLERKYFREYSDQWRESVRSTHVKSFNQNPELMDKTLNAFSSSDSPMKIYLEALANQTNLSANAEPAGWIEWFKSFFTKADKDDTGGNTEVEKEFRPLFPYVGSGEEDTGEEKVLPIDKYGGEMKRLSDTFSNMSGSQRGKIADEFKNEEGKAFGTLRNSEKKISSSLESFKTPAGQEITRLMEEPLVQINAFFGYDVKNRQEKEWAESVLPKAREIENGFPFSTTGEADIAKLTAFLNPVDGTLTKFYKENLEANFEERDGQFVPKEGAPKYSPGFVAYINNAFRLRKALFGESPTPKFEYDFALKPANNSIIEITIDGQKISSTGTASVKLKFPAASGTETGVSIVVTPNEGVVGAPPPAGDSSANSSDETVPSQDTSNLGTTNASSAGATEPLKFPGTWGLFKFFDAGSPKKNESGGYTLTHKVGGASISSTIRPTGGDLFDRSIFTNLKAPDAFMQQN